MRLPALLALLLGPLGALLGAQAPAALEQGASAVRPTEHPFLWVVEGRTPSYLFGTIHIPDERVTTLPDVVDEAIEGADALYTELAMDGVTMGKAAAGFLLEDGRTLREVVPADLYARMREYVESKGHSMAMFERMKPWAAATQLALLDYLEAMMKKAPLDMALYARARDAGKEVGGLETVEEQLGVFEHLTDDEQVAFLELSLEDVVEAEKEGESAIEQLVQVYLAGDEDALAEEMKAWVGEESPLMRELERALIVDRNVRMAARIAEKVEQDPHTSFVFAVGAAHFPGKYGIVNLLEAEGLEVERIGSPEPSSP